MPDKIIRHSKLGNITYKKSTKAKKMRITIKPFKGVIVTIPKYISYQQGQMFVEQNTAWIRKQLKKMQAHEVTKSYTFGDTYQTHYTTINIVATDNTEATVSYLAPTLTIAIPKTEPIDSPAWQETIRTQIEEQLRREAKQYLIPKTYLIAKKHHIRINKVTIRKTTSRWGSCSSLGNINLSIYCMTLPIELQEYIIYHELAHIKEKNHSAAYWNHLQSLLPNALELDKQMKNYQTSI